jgi:hypothetical protein
MFIVKANDLIYKGKVSDVTVKANDLIYNGKVSDVTVKANDLTYNGKVSDVTVKVNDLTCKSRPGTNTLAYYEADEEIKFCGSETRSTSKVCSDRSSATLPGSCWSCRQQEDG